MIQEHSPDSLVDEATDSNTNPSRLAELSAQPHLLPFIAANPATPAEILGKLAHDENVVVRRAVAKNPNTPLKTLINMIPEFPHSFLCNPIIPLVNLSDPRFLEKLSLEEAWPNLLRCDNVPAYWLKWFREHCLFDRWLAALYAQRLQSQLDSHVAIAGEASEDFEEKAAEALNAYYQDISTLDNCAFLAFCLSSQQAPEWWRDEFRALLPQQKADFIYYYRGMTGEFLTSLAEDLAMHFSLARHPLTPAAILHELATSVQHIRLQVANNPSTPEALLQRLAQDDDARVRKAVALHPRAPLQALELLARDPLPSVRAAVARHDRLPQLAPDLHQRVLHDSSSQVRESLARNPHISPAILSVLAGDTEPTVRQAVASNPRLPATTLLALARDKEENMRRNLANNPRLPHKLLLHLANDPSFAVRRLVAANPNMMRPMLEELILTGKVPWEGVARNPHATPALLAQLASDGNTQIQAAVAAHKRTPPAVLVSLASSSAFSIRQAVATNPNAPLEALKQVLDANNPNLLKMIARHPEARKTPTLFFDYLLKMLRGCLQPYQDSSLYHDPGFRKLFLKHEATPVTYLRRYAASPIWQDRYLVARHPATPPALVNALASDGNRYVRAAVREILTKRNITKGAK